MREPLLRDAVVAEARSWIATPYLHQASLKGAGADCLGVLRGVWWALNGVEPETPPAYTPAWAEVRGEETLLAAAERHLDRIPIADFVAGDVLLFRWRSHCPCKHVAIVTERTPDRIVIVHAYDRHAVAEHVLPPAWRRRIAAAFAFRDVA